MKKSILTLAAVCMLLMSFGSREKAHALGPVDIGIGLSGFYAWWDPAVSGVYDDTEVTNGFLWGPVLSLTFFKKVYLVGSFIETSNFDSRYTVRGTDSTWGDFTAKTERKQKVSNIDLMLGYKITPFTSVFIGLKSFSYDNGGQLHVTEYIGSTTNEWSGDQGEFQSEGDGYAIGISHTFALGGNNFINTSISGIYYKSDLVVSIQESVAYGTSYGYGACDVYEITATGIGASCNVSFSHYFDLINTAISIGGRFQYIHYSHSRDDIKYRYPNNIQNPDRINHIGFDDDYFYGITMSAIFYF
ncbi:MAG TPA: hypothetical protein PK544_17275 [Spirochaetota bacterium]|nr:hypothetical protein [Spirochaetota bacterium]HPJ37931.1 hypothetical protein [Spirochaetota bacterium]HPQ54955.1 hypothetical protein [Spirochaetota bacterium]